MELAGLTISEAHKGLKDRDFSAVELTRAYFKRVKEKNKDIFAFLSTDEESAVSQAREVDLLISQKKEIPMLAGIPCAVKDNILVRGMACTAGSKILENYIAPYDATVVKKLKSQKAVILGKANLDEFALGSSTENSAFGSTKNPHDLARVPGGSSGGSAAAVAADLSVFALGSDTGGSIREPASFCGVVGMKPTYGAVSRCGLVAFASSLDQIGPLAKTAEDCQIVFDAVKGKDPLDSTSMDAGSESKPLNDLVIGIPKEYFVEGIDPEVEKIIKKAISQGIIKSDETLSDRDIFNLIFEPGFSTAKKVTDVSGRGVGMDVVKKNITGLRGRVEIQTEAGKGSAFSIRLPLTMAIIEGMVIRIGNERYILPTLSITTSYRPKKEDISSVVKRGEMLSLHGKLLPLFRLSKIFNLKNCVSDPTQGLVVVVESDGHQVGFLTDELLGQQQIVIKSLGASLQGIPGISGGAILPDGHVGLILDISGLIALAHGNIISA